MTDATGERPSLKDFDAYADRNGQDLGQDNARDIGLATRTQGDLKGNPSGEAETARIASGTPGSDATDATEAETPPENLRRIGDAAQAAGSPRGAAAEAIDRATAPVGSDEGE
ncbi:hypothetical protein PMNALOAF_1872 [Methylobacterium adhaesivum]|uniref:Stress-induced protein n=1 Tax=Methylobacterium adhaesivum TaxID=333297 RepID=A0ABT8BC41_9HYPH|nr:hypothetical protein [Methylobacterium adhaesivum]MDN3589607.1 hypothetical protein [Methylobacterium adhaesivum]GJD30624.1 hypothetical protein PMNALOAF_1872 [Methylobacterium adhaesivum]